MSTWPIPLAAPDVPTLDAYRERFPDPAYWAPYACAVLDRHGFGPGRAIRRGALGTHPVSIVDDRWVVKLYAPFFDNPDEARNEWEGLQRAASAGLPVPKILANGELFPKREWRWPYLVTSFVPGQSLAEVRQRVSEAGIRAIAAELGAFLRLLHARSPRDESGSWEDFLDATGRRFEICRDDHARWGSLPARLVDSIDAYLIPIEELMDLSLPPSLIHGDLDDDHLLGHLTDGGWATTGIIDFGDASVGDPIQDLIPLHFGLFDADPGLLRAMLDAYGPGLGPADSFVRRAMTYSLLLRFDAFSDLERQRPGLLSAARALEDLARAIWDVG